MQRLTPSPVLLLLLLLGPMAGGCATVRITDSPRTATEQFLLSQAASDAVQQLSAAALRDRQVFIDERYFESVDKPYVLGELRAYLLLNGVRLTNDRAEAQIIIEARTRGVGIDRYDYLFGIPPVLIPADAISGNDDGSGTLVTPELAFVKTIRQRGYASIAYVAYWADTGEIIASSGPFVGTTEREDWWFFGVGPRTTGNVPTVE